MFKTKDQDALSESESESSYCTNSFSAATSWSHHELLGDAKLARKFSISSRLTIFSKQILDIFVVCQSPPACLLLIFFTKSQSRLISQTYLMKSRSRTAEFMNMTPD